MGRSPYLIFRGNSYYFRRAVPSELRWLLGRRELLHSLHTPDLRIARLRASQLAVLSDQLFKNCGPETASMLDERFKAAARKLAQDQEDRITNLYDEWLATDDASSTELERIAGNADQAIVEIAMQQNPDFGAHCSSKTEGPDHKTTLVELGGSQTQELVDTTLSQIENDDSLPERFRDLLNDPEHYSYMRRQLETAYRRAFDSLDEVKRKGVRPNPSTNKRAQAPEQEATPDAPKFYEAWLEYAAERTPRWSDRTKKQYESRIQEALLDQMIGNKPVNKITKQDAIRYRDNLLSLPAQRTSKKDYKNKPLEELLSTTIPESDRNSNKTVNERLTLLHSFLGWCIEQYNLQIQNPVKNLSLPNNSRPRAPFTVRELRLLFQPDLYAQTCSRYPNRFWAPLIALFSGARQSEICQLTTYDITEEEGYLIISINDDAEDKRLKNESSRRIIPVHPYLSDLGFDTYVEEIRNRGYRLLFPDIPTNLDRRGKKVTDWFSKHRDKVKVPKTDNLGREKVFHSFRNVVDDALYQYRFDSGASIDPNRIKRIMGHTTTPDMTEHYSQGTSIEHKFDLLSRITFDIEINQLRDIWPPILQQWIDTGEPLDYGN